MAPFRPPPGLSFGQKLFLAGLGAGVLFEGALLLGFLQVDLPEPSLPALRAPAFEAEALPIFPTLPPSWTPANTATPLPTRTPRPTSTLTLTPSLTPPPSATRLLPSPTPTLGPFFATPGASGGPKRFVVILSEQRLYAYEGETLVHTTLVSTGTADYPTVIGEFKIYWKRLRQDISGPGYVWRDVPYLQYFYEDFALHAAYWHNDFGRPVSHGCINLSVPEAEWAYGWAEVGTGVVVNP